MTSAVVIVTRPQPDAARLAARLEQAGLTSVVAPLISIEPRSVDPLPVGDVQTVVFTSANGVRGLMARPDGYRFTGVPAIAVGPASAVAARAAGFGCIIEAAGDVDAVVSEVQQYCQPGKGTILYPSGVHTAGDLAGQLAALGFTVARVVVYHAVHAQALPREVEELLGSRTQVAVCLYSPRTARIWCTLMGRLGRNRTGAGFIRYYCLSDNVAKAVRESGCPAAGLEVAGAANDDAMVSILSATLGGQG